jgi:alanine dehydrogenase
VNSADEVWAQGEMIVKVKEPIEPEYPRMREDQLLLLICTSAPDVELTDQLLQRRFRALRTRQSPIVAGHCRC